MYVVIVRGSVHHPFDPISSPFDIVSGLLRFLRMSPDRGLDTATLVTLVLGGSSV